MRVQLRRTNGWMDRWMDGQTNARTKSCCGEEDNWKEVGEEKNESRKKSKRRRKKSLQQRVLQNQVKLWLRAMIRTHIPRQ